MWKVAVVIPLRIAQSTVRAKDVAIVAVQPEDEAPVDHDAEIVEPPDDVSVAAAEVLALARAREPAGRQRLESDEQAAQSCGRSLFDDVVAKDRVHRRGALEDPAHSPHAAEEFFGEPRIPEEVVVQEVEVAARKAGDFGERGVHALRVERGAAVEEGVLVAEGAVVRAASRDDDGVGDEIELPPNEVPADRRQLLQGPRGRFVTAQRATGLEIAQEPRERVLAGPQEDRVRVRRGLLRQGRDVEASEHDVGSPRPIVVGDPVGAVGVGDVDLDDDEVRVIVEIEPLDVLVLEDDFEVGIEIGREGRQAQGREQGVLDRAPEGTRRFRQGGEDEFDAPDRDGRSWCREHNAKYFVIQCSCRPRAGNARESARAVRGPRHRRRSRRHRGRACRGADGPAHGPADGSAVGDRADVLQSRDRRPGQGAARARNRCARRPDGRPRRRGRDPVPHPQPFARSGRVGSARAVRSSAVRASGGATDGRDGEPDRTRGDGRGARRKRRPRVRRRDVGGRAHRGRRRRRDGGNVPERPDAHGGKEDRGRSRRGAGGARVSRAASRRSACVSAVSRRARRRACTATRSTTPRARRRKATGRRCRFRSARSGCRSARPCAG